MSTNVPLPVQIKLHHLLGLQEVVLAELERHADLSVVATTPESVYLAYTDNLTSVLSLRSVLQAFFVMQDARYNPSYLAKHKSLVGNLITMVVDRYQFKTFRIICAGADSVEIRSIAQYVSQTFDMLESDEADLKLHIIRLDSIWEVGVQITPRPLSLRDYRVQNMSGGMDPTAAYALNFLCGLYDKKTYLNLFSGSGTLLIEAGLAFSNLEKMIGLEKEKQHISMSIHNITKAGLIKKIQIVQGDIFEKPDLGTFDVVVADLPFGMAIGKDDDLEKLYQAFLDYSESLLVVDGVLGIYTSQFALLERLLAKSNFTITKTITVKNITAVDSYLKTKIVVCSLK